MSYLTRMLVPLAAACLQSTLVLGECFTVWILLTDISTIICPAIIGELEILINLEILLQVSCDFLEDNDCGILHEMKYDRVIACLQQPVPLEYIPVEAEYHKDFSKLLQSAARDYGTLAASVSDIHWTHSFQEPPSVWRYNNTLGRSKNDALVSKGRVTLRADFHERTDTPCVTDRVGAMY
ncbi:augmin subunit 2 [Tanacetum coccineum]